MRRDQILAVIVAAAALPLAALMAVIAKQNSSGRDPTASGLAGALALALLVIPMLPLLVLVEPDTELGRLLVRVGVLAANRKSRFGHPLLLALIVAILLEAIALIAVITAAINRREET